MAPKTPETQTQPTTETIPETAEMTEHTMRQAIHVIEHAYKAHRLTLLEGMRVQFNLTLCVNFKKLIGH